MNEDARIKSLYIAAMALNVESQGMVAENVASCKSGGMPTFGYSDFQQTAKAMQVIAEQLQAIANDPVA
jgi:hypothetical protein